MASSIRKLNNDLYVQTEGPDLHLVMERVNSSNKYFWSSFFLQIGQFAKQIEASAQESRFKREYMAEGYCRLDDSLFAASYHPHEFWVLFASALDIDADNPHPKEQIEMVCTVSTAEGSPFTTHMGTTRTIRSVTGALFKHPNLSINLHAFGARVMKMLHPEKIYMITCPTGKMEQIFQRALGKEHVHIGLHEVWQDELQSCQEEMEALPDGEDREDAQLGINYYQDRIDACGNDPVMTVGHHNHSFSLRDLERNILLDLNAEQMYEEYGWYFNRHRAISDFDNIIAVPLDVLALAQYPELPIN